jgi:hypothetical protein
MVTNKELIEKANVIFGASLDKHLPSIPELAKLWDSYSAFENCENKTLQELLLESNLSNRYEADLRVVAAEATISFNSWLLENKITTPYNVIDEKSRLYAPFSALIEFILEIPKVTVVHPVTGETIFYDYNAPCVTVDSYMLNRSSTTPEDVVFYGSSESQITGKAFALPN